ncbi:MAG: calcium-binding protein, partial [Pseudomonadota bacterium]
MATFNGDGGNNTLTGLAEDDTINGFGGADVLRGLAGNDLIDGGGNGDSIDAGAGNDSVEAGGGADVVTHVLAENLGAVDTYDGEAGTDTLRIEVTA